VANDSHQTSVEAQIARFLPFGAGVRLIGADANGVFAVDKPPGVLSHPNGREEGTGSLIEAPYDAERRCYGPFSEGCPFTEVFLLHRLDSATSGVIVLATREDVATALREAFESETVQKLYHALVKGRPPAVPPVWVDRLERTHRDGKLRVVGGQGAPVRTAHSWLRSDPNQIGAGLLELRPVTGRSHQLRVQCKLHGCPILGDRTYGDFAWNKRVRQRGVSRRLFLHASDITLPYHYRGADHTFTASAPLPVAFHEVLEPNAHLDADTTPDTATAASNAPAKPSPPHRSRRTDRRARPRRRGTCRRTRRPASAPAAPARRRHRGSPLPPCRDTR